MDDLISRKELLESIEKVSVKGNVLDDDWVYRFVQEFPSIDAVNHTADYDEKNDILFVHLSPDNSNSYGEEIDKNIIIMRDMDSNEITGVMLYGFNKYVKKGKNHE